MSDKKIIAVSGGMGATAGGFMRSGISPAYFDSVIRAGGAPLMLPYSRDKESIKAALSVCDALIMSGGPDIDPVLYGQEVHRLCGEIDEYRDAFEYLLLETAVELNKPILGICRGIQILNVYFGGSLYQDVSLSNPQVLQHLQKGKRGYGIHAIEVEEGSFLAKAVGGTKAFVNSYHHQSLKDIAPGFKATAKASDGIVEAFQHESKKIFGVQFHPEMMTENSEQMLSIFKTFIASIDE